jgi:hypothetical protein
VIAELERCDAGVTLRFEGKSVSFPPQAVEAVVAAHAAGGPFTPAALPGPLDSAGRLVLVKRLIREGFLLASDL